MVGMSETTQKTVLVTKFSPGPLGLGDPEDKSLRKVEIDVVVPQRMRSVAKYEKCVPQVEKFTKCCQENGLSMVLFCRKENAAMIECFTSWYNDDGFRKKCAEDYLNDRSEYRRTGVPQQYKKPYTTYK